MQAASIAAPGLTRLDIGPAGGGITVTAADSQAIRDMEADVRFASRALKNAGVARDNARRNADNLMEIAWRNQADPRVPLDRAADLRAAEELDKAKAYWHAMYGQYVELSSHLKHMRRTL